MHWHGKNLVEFLTEHSECTLAGYSSSHNAVAKGRFNAGSDTNVVPGGSMLQRVFLHWSSREP